MAPLHHDLRLGPVSLFTKRRLSAPSQALLAPRESNEEWLYPGKFVESGDPAEWRLWRGPELWSKQAFEGEALPWLSLETQRYRGWH